MGSLFKSPEMPEIKPPTPVADEAMLAKARKKKIATAQKRTGRSATILSNKETLGA